MEGISLLVLRPWPINGKTHTERFEHTKGRKKEKRTRTRKRRRRGRGRGRGRSNPHNLVSGLFSCWVLFLSSFQSLPPSLPLSFPPSHGSTQPFFLSCLSLSLFLVLRLVCMNLSFFLLLLLLLLSFFVPGLLVPLVALCLGLCIHQSLLGGLLLFHLCLNSLPFSFSIP